MKLLILAGLIVPLAAALAGLVLAGPARSQIVESTSFASAIVQARELIRAEAKKVPGVSVAVAVEGQIAWSEAFGYANFEGRQPATPSTRFRIASVSKALTAAGLMLLVERGALDLDAPVQRYVPDFPAKAQGVITPRLLAGHLAGIRHYEGRETYLNQPYATVRSGLAIFAADPLVAAPGEKFHYSTYGWSLLSAAMETAAKRDFPGFMEAEVLRPLGLERTRIDRAGLADRDRAHFYVPGPDRKFRPARPINSSYKWAGGGYLSTAEDLVRYGSALLGPGFLQQASLAQLFTPQRTAAGQSTGYGIGWSLGGNQRSPAYWHTGGQPGCTAILLIRPRDRVVVAILTNISDSEITKQAGAIADLFAARPN